MPPCITPVPDRLRRDIAACPTRDATPGTRGGGASPPPPPPSTSSPPSPSTATPPAPTSSTSVAGPSPRCLARHPLPCRVLPGRLREGERPWPSIESVRPEGHGDGPLAQRFHKDLTQDLEAIPWRPASRR